MSGFEIINPGILTLIQDKGRFSYAHIGVTSSGCMDEYAYFWANKLLGNAKDCNVLEIAFPSFSVKASSDISISITGADLSLSINGKYSKPWSTYNIKKGDILKFCKSLKGVRAYLAVKGGFLLEKDFDSYSTTIKEGLGAIKGRALIKSDFLPYTPYNHNHKKVLKDKYIPSYDETLVLRVLLSYQKDEFEEKEKEKFFSSEFSVSPESNRMGMKLNGEKITPKISGIISEGIAFGSIQIPSSGQPIILLKDRQTIGGYAKIGSVLAIDCFKLSQAKNNTKIRFEEIDIKSAQEKMKNFYLDFDN